MNRIEMIEKLNGILEEKKLTEYTFFPEDFAEEIKNFTTLVKDSGIDPNFSLFNELIQEFIGTSVRPDHIEKFSVVYRWNFVNVRDLDALNLGHSSLTIYL